uniref:Uncharacterized protein n=1 Tax=Tanacetum cinerariifolium TaxID=118510 RepID=A0A6L2MD62_TANCI|nr:hypothetical protein [Tanacetum cinerariifolium]
MGLFGLAKISYYNGSYTISCVLSVQDSLALLEWFQLSHWLVSVSLTEDFLWRRSSLKCRVIEKIWNIPAKRKAFAANKDSRIKGIKWASCQGPLCATTVVIGNFALLIQSIYDKDAKGIVIHCSSILLYILWQLKIIMGTKAYKLLLVSVLAMVGYPLWSYMTSQYHHGERTIASRYINKAWNWAAYKAFLHVIAQKGLPFGLLRWCWSNLDGSSRACSGSAVQWVIHGS